MTKTRTCKECKFPIKLPHCKDGHCSHRTHCTCERSEKRQEHTHTIIGEVDGWKITKHALDRWRERSVIKPGRITPPCSIEEGWKRAVPVGSSEAGKQTRVRLYGPLDLVFIANCGKIRTVAPTRFHQLKTDHLKECGHCGEFWDPSRTDDCHWCERPEKDNARMPKSRSYSTTQTSNSAGDTGEKRTCDGCGRDIVAFGGESKCKACRLTDHTEEPEQEDQFCRADGCYESPNRGSDYCSNHQYLVTAELTQSEQISRQEVASRD